MIITLPPLTKKLAERYLSLKLGGQVVSCPYFQNLNKRFSSLALVGKGTPEEIENETKKLFIKIGKDIHNYSPGVIRFHMIMAGIGIDCSGLVSNILKSLLMENSSQSIQATFKPKQKSLPGLIRYYTRPTGNLSADALTSEENCTKILDANNILPGDLLRVGPGHVAIITEVEKEGRKVKSVTYCHSTYDYLDKYGVREGSILITKPNKDLSRQNWIEYYRGRNWMLEDYLKAPANDRGIKRPRIFSKH
jgi:hypothetical protein